ncbi:hypothetical protein BDN70DRAFT_923122 [Pholiota conissans]|uniref:Uncharacterized protein n=1 Tax=Pholiota conissans TaxID=109636 RepID=A0A9P6CXM0_9AGAR|nr:hypothetical protein BDN70DRAFT_923122 [Pholiota conissans]
MAANEVWDKIEIQGVEETSVDLSLLRVPPEPGHADVSFWYATYCVAGIFLLFCCGIYYWLWTIVLPRRGGYELVEEIEESSDGARNTKLTRRYIKSSADEGEQQPLLTTT